MRPAYIEDALFRCFVESSIDAILLIDDEGIVQTANAAVTTLLGMHALWGFNHRFF